MKRLMMAICAVLFSGCASMAVTDDLLQQRTAFALGLDADGFTISDRQDDGFRTQYAVKTKTGQRHSCYVTGTFTQFGRSVSDAICNKPGERVKNPLTGQ